MKTFIILVLSAALTAAAAATKPSATDFRRYLVAERIGSDGNPFSRGWDEMKANHDADRCKFKDRLLWVDVEINGKDAYSGAFSHWLDRTQISRLLEQGEQPHEAVVEGEATKPGHRK